MAIKTVYCGYAEFFQTFAHIVCMNCIIFTCVKGMATAIRSTGCCAIANSVSLRQAQNSVKQDKCERASSAGGATGATLAPSASGLTSDLFCSKTSLMPKNRSRPKFSFGLVSPIRSKMFVPGISGASISTWWEHGRLGNGLELYIYESLLDV